MILRTGLSIAAAILALLAISYRATRPLRSGDTAMPADPNLPTIRHSGREHADERFKFADRPSAAAEAK